MPRPQFSLKSLLWLMVVVAAFCAGAAWQRDRDWQEWLAMPKNIYRFERIAKDGGPTIVPEWELERELADD